jgi:hypothetical protein
MQKNSERRTCKMPTCLALYALLVSLNNSASHLQL